MWTDCVFNTDFFKIFNELTTPWLVLKKSLTLKLFNPVSKDLYQESMLSLLQKRLDSGYRYAKYPMTF